MIGITDHWDHTVNKANVPSTGAKLYVESTPAAAASALRMVCALLEEDDIAIPSERSDALILSDGRTWGRAEGSGNAECNAEWEERLGVPPAAHGGMWQALSPDEKKSVLEKAQAVISTEPANSSLSRFAQGVTVALGRYVSDDIQEAQKRIQGSEGPWGRAAGPCSEIAGWAAPPRTLLRTHGLRPWTLALQGSGGAAPGLAGVRGKRSPFGPRSFDFLIERRGLSATCALLLPRRAVASLQALRLPC